MERKATIENKRQDGVVTAMSTMKHHVADDEPVSIRIKVKPMEHEEQRAYSLFESQTTMGLNKVAARRLYCSGMEVSYERHLTEPFEEGRVGSLEMLGGKMSMAIKETHTPQPSNPHDKEEVENVERKSMEDKEETRQMHENNGVGNTFLCFEVHSLCKSCLSISKPSIMGVNSRPLDKANKIS
ncbi:hypothetical protein TanjilG_14997 [Lupinus angustifolius]|uniref:Uncharacterized protein n=1 Tax=Lupinus angustifolius TaxID=3871 RepID=A0A4P1RAI4_LUPAN|nr:hypothetical protein TanjilG_14997 [Lupinus angustifolius]